MLITTHDAFAQMVASWDPDRPVGLDFETNGKEAWELGARIVGLSLAGHTLTGEVTGGYIPVAHAAGPNLDPIHLSDISAFLAKVPVVPFYTQMEASWAAAKLRILLSVAGDGYVAARLLQLQQFGLKDLTLAVLKRPVIRFEDLIPDHHDFSVLDSSDPRVEAYCTADAVNGLQLEEVLRAQVLLAGLGPVYEVEVRTAAMMAIATLEGYFVDEAEIIKAVAAEAVRLRGLEAEIYQGLGGRFLINSNKQIGERMARQGVRSPLKTETGGESWSIEALTLVAHRHPMIPKIIEWRKAFAVINAAKQTPLTPADDGRVHPTWQVIGATGGSRMVCDKPSLSNLPKGIRRAFPIKAGQWVRLQWKNADLRMLALLSGETGLDPYFKEPDFYEAIRPVLGSEVTWDDAERFVQAFIRHDREGVAERMVGWPGGRADAVWLLFDQMFPRIQSYLTSVRQRALSGTVTTWLNRTWKIREDSERDLFVKACSAVVDQSVGTALKVCLCLLGVRMAMGQPSLRYIRQILPITDTLFYCIPKDLPLEAHLPAVRSLFELPLDQTRGLKLALTFAAGPTWGELEEVPPDVASGYVGEEELYQKDEHGDRPDAV